MLVLSPPKKTKIEEIFQVGNGTNFSALRLHFFDSKLGFCPRTSEADNIRTWQITF